METSYTQRALKAIADTLNAGVEDVRAVTIVIGVVIFLFAIGTVIIRVKLKRRTRKAAEASYQKLIRKHNLPILELDLIDELSKNLRAPDKKYLLLVNKSIFRQAVKKMGDLPENKTEHLESLRERLGFSAAAEALDGSTTKSFLKGMPVYLEITPGNYLNAEIYSVAETGIEIKFDSTGEPFEADKRLNLYAFSFNGIHLYQIKILKSREGLISAAHSKAEQLKKAEVKLEVNVKIENPEGGETLKSLILLLSGNGAVMQNPDNSIRQGDDIRIFPAADAKGRFPVSAEVIKVSPVKKLLSAKFTHL
jgi:hypothetical protein